MIRRYTKDHIRSLKVCFDELRGDGVGCLALALTYAFLGLLSVHAYVSCRAKVHTDNFIE